MSKYTAEQVRACILAYKNGDLNYCRSGIVDLLTEYAAILAAQGQGERACVAEHGSLAHRIYCEIACNGDSACFFGLDDATQQRWIRGIETVLGTHPAPAASPAGVPDGDTARLEFLIKHHLRVKRLKDSNLWMVLSHDGHPSTGGEYEEWREAIDEAMIAAAPSPGESA